MNSRFVGAIVLFSAFAVGMPSAAATAGQGPGKQKKADKAGDKREKGEDKREKAEDKREKAEDKREKVEDKREKAENKREKVEDKREKTEDRREKAEDRRERHDDRNDRAVVVDRDGHVRVIREYPRGSLPPGLARRESLPPGLRNQLRERGELPPGLHKRLVPVPAPLLTRLPAVPAYYTRYFAGDDFIVVDTRTNRIVAVVRDVWR